MKKNSIKWIIDLVMGLMFLLFFNSRVLGGLTYHEIAGLVFAGVFLTHVLLNSSWVKNITLRMFDGKLPWRARGAYLLNFLLLLSMSCVIFSGIVISRVVFPNFNLGNESWFRTAHEALSFFVLILVGLHVGIHWHWVVNVFKKMVGLKAKVRWTTYVLPIAALAILLFGVYEIQQTSFLNRVASVSSVFSGSGGDMRGHGTFEAGGNHPTGFKGGHGFASAGGQKPDLTNGQRPNFAHRQGLRGEGDGGGANVLGVIVVYSAITGVFVVLSYYLRKLFVRRRQSANAIG